MEGGGAARSYGGDAPAVGEGGGRAGGAGLEAVDGARLAMRFPSPSSLGPSKISLFRGSGSGAAGRVPRGGLNNARFLGQCSQNRVFWDPSVALAGYPPITTGSRSSTPRGIRQASLFKLSHTMAKRTINIPLSRLTENPLLPAACATEIRNRPSTKEWLDKVYRVVTRLAEKDVKRSEAPEWLAMISPESVLRENFENYIARIGEEDYLDMASMKWGIPIENARPKQKRQLLRLAQKLHAHFEDWDGSLWICMVTEHMKTVQLLDLLSDNISFTIHML